MLLTLSVNFTVAIWYRIFRLAFVTSQLNLTIPTFPHSTWNERAITFSSHTKRNMINFLYEPDIRRKKKKGWGAHQITKFGWLIKLSTVGWTVARLVMALNERETVRGIIVELESVCVQFGMKITINHRRALSPAQIASGFFYTTESTQAPKVKL